MSEQPEIYIKHDYDAAKHEHSETKYLRADIHESALAESRQEVERLRKALEWYAHDVHNCFDLMDDRGRRAREALHPTQPAEGRKP